jgi:hypothetical protein
MDDRSFARAEAAWERRTLDDYLSDECTEGCIQRALEEDPDVDVETVECDCQEYFEIGMAEARLED